MYSKKHYVHEIEGLAQFITFTFMPIFLSWDNVVKFGAEITGTSNLYRKYRIRLNANTGRGKEAELKHYYDSLVPNIQQLFLCIKESILPEMNRVNSYERFVAELINPKASFFERTFHGSDIWYHRYNPVSFNRNLKNLDASSALAVML